MKQQNNSLKIKSDLSNSNKGEKPPDNYFDKNINSDLLLEAFLKMFPNALLVLNNERIVIDFKSSSTDNFYFLQDDLIGKKIEDIFPSEASKKFSDAAINSSKNNSSFTFEYSIIKNEKINFYEAKLLHFNENKIFVVIRNITDAIMAEEEKQYSVELYKILIETSSDAIVLIDVDGKILMSNNHVASLFGFTSVDETIGLNVNNFIQTEHKRKFKGIGCLRCATKMLEIANIF